MYQSSKHFVVSALCEEDVCGCDEVILSSLAFESIGEITNYTSHLTSDYKPKHQGELYVEDRNGRFYGAQIAYVVAPGDNLRGRIMLLEENLSRG